MRGGSDHGVQRCSGERARRVGRAYLRHFDFEGQSFDGALRYGWPAFHACIGMHANVCSWV
jgi:hypothetical protein